MTVVGLTDGLDQAKARHPAAQHAGPVCFRVAGIPVTQGSKSGFVVSGRVVLREGSTARAAADLKAWRYAVATEARRACAAPLDGPLLMTLIFGLPRPASAPKRRRTWPTGHRSGDIDKLIRAVLDGCTGVCYADDAQVVGVAAIKDYGPPGVAVEVARWGDAGVDYRPVWASS